MNNRYGKLNRQIENHEKRCTRNNEVIPWIQLFITKKSLIQDKVKSKFKGSFIQIKNQIKRY